MNRGNSDKTLGNGVKNGVENMNAHMGRGFIAMNYLMCLIYVDFEQKNIDNIKRKENLKFTEG